MTKEIIIDGRSVVFRATAAVPRLYRIKFRRDIMQDMKEIDSAVKIGGERRRKHSDEAFGSF